MEEKLLSCLVGISNLDEVVTYGLTGEIYCMTADKYKETEIDKGKVQILFRLTSRCTYEEEGENIKVKGYISPKNIEKVRVIE